MNYAITVEGELPEYWSTWFEGLRVATDEHGRSTIYGSVSDQAALFGVLAKVSNLGLPLVAVRRLDEI
jgi:hypothetical protein